VLQAGNISGIPVRVLENPPATQCNVSDILDPPFIVLAPKQVIVICVPTETWGCWGVIAAWGIEFIKVQKLTINICVMKVNLWRKFKNKKLD